MQGTLLLIFSSLFTIRPYVKVVSTSLRMQTMYYYHMFDTMAYIDA